MSEWEIKREDQKKERERKRKEFSAWVGERSSPRQLLYKSSRPSERCCLGYVIYFKPLEFLCKSVWLMLLQKRSVDAVSIHGKIKKENQNSMANFKFSE